MFYIPDICCPREANSSPWWGGFAIAGGVLGFIFIWCFVGVWAHKWYDRFGDRRAERLHRQAFGEPRPKYTRYDRFGDPLP